MKKLKGSVKNISILMTAAFLLLIVSAVPASAQDYAPFEIFGGYNLLRLGLGDTSAGESLITDQRGSFRNMNGWNVAFTANINPMLGIKAEFAGVYQKYSANATFPGLGNAEWDWKHNSHSFVVGPQIAARTGGPVTPFGHFMVGFARHGGELSGEIDFGGWGSDVVDAETDSTTGLAMAIGGGIDINMSRNWAIRGQFDYFPWRNEGITTNNIRLTTGIVFRFGK